MDGLDGGDPKSYIREELLKHILFMPEGSDNQSLLTLFSDEKIMNKIRVKCVIHNWLEAIKPNIGTHKGIPKTLSPEARNDKLLVDILGPEKADKVYMTFNRMLTYIQRLMYRTNAKKIIPFPLSPQELNAAITAYVITAIDVQAMPAPGEFIHMIIENKKLHNESVKITTADSKDSAMQQDAEQPKKPAGYRRLGGAGSSQ